MLVKSPFPTAKDNLTLLFQKNRKLVDAAVSTSQPSKSARRAFSLSFVCANGLLFNHDTTRLHESVDQTVENFQSCLEAGQFVQGDMLKIVSVLLASAFLVNKESSQFVSECYRMISLIVKTLCEKSIRNLDVASTRHYLVAIRLFLVGSSALPKPSEEVIVSASWMEMLQSLAGFLNTASAKYQGKSAIGTLEEDFALRGFLPLGAVYRDAYFKDKRKAASEGELTAMRCRSILQLAKTCCDLQVQLNE